MLNSINIARERMGSINLPTLVFHGTADQLVPLSASEFAFANIGTAESDKRFEVSIYLSVYQLLL